MKLSIILSVFERHYVVSLGSEVQHNEQHDPDRVELHSAPEYASVGFRPNDEEDDDDNG